MKKPFLHALAAALYIVTIVLIVNTTANVEIEESILMPMAALSLFVLSAAIMGFLFLSEPLKLFLDNKKQEAVTFFAKTVGIFACFVATFGILVLVLG